MMLILAYSLIQFFAFHIGTSCFTRHQKTTLKHKDRRTTEKLIITLITRAPAKQNWLFIFMPFLESFSYLAFSLTFENKAVSLWQESWT